ncbi:MAG: homoserine O-acetyltransferase [Bacteroidales bacterium]|nr:homoserine O-acetyltransferase [Candidatus Cacconaster merdequi]
MMTVHHVTIDEPFDFEGGGHIPSLDITYHSSAQEYRKGDKVVWICHALTANSNPEEWWPGMVGPGLLIDTDRYFVICANMLGSPYGTSGPAAISPETGKPYLFDFPKVTARDNARMCAILRRHIGIEKIDVLVGSSVGGFYAMEWAVIEPDTIVRAVFLATSSRVSPYLTAFNESQRMALEADQTFRKAQSLKGGEAGLRCARSIALISYRSFDGYNSTQAENEDETMFAHKAASYQRHQGRKLSERFDAYSYWYLTQMFDSHNIGRGRGGERKALSSIKASVTVIAITSDCMFPSKDMRKMASLIPGAEFHTIDSKFGHDGFLLENEQLTRIIGPVLL